MKNKYFGSVSLKSVSNTYGSFESVIGLDETVRQLKIGQSGVFIAPAGCGRTHFLKCISEHFIKINVVCIYIDLSLVSNSEFIFRKEQLEKIENAEQAIILLDGFEHISLNNRSLYSVLVSIEERAQSTKLQFLLTCLPIDYSINKPHEIIIAFQEDIDFFEVVANPLTIDELEAYVEALPIPEYSGLSRSLRLLELLNWIQYQGLESYCCWPKDLNWFESLFDTYEGDEFIPLEYVHESWTRYELEYAYRRYDFFDLGKASLLLQEVCLASTFSGLSICELVGKYDFCIAGDELLAVLRSSLFRRNLQTGVLIINTIENYRDWLISKLYQRKINEGMPEKFLLDFSHVSIGSKEKLRGYSKGAMVFLSVKPDHHRIKKQMIYDHPEAMIDMADPNQLNVIERRQILQNLQSKLQGQDIGYDWIESGLKKYFNAQLESFICDQYELFSSKENLNKNHAYIKLLTELADFAGKEFLLSYASCVLPRLTEKMWSLESATIRYLGRRGGDQYRQKLVEYVFYCPDESPEDIKWYARRLYHVVNQTFKRGMEIPQFIDNLKKVIDVQTNEGIGLESFISYRMWDRLSITQDKDQIIEGLLDILTAKDESINYRYRWLISALGKLALQRINESESLNNTSPEFNVLKSYLNWHAPSLMNTNHAIIPLSVAIDNFFKHEKIIRAWVRYKFIKSEKDSLTIHALTCDVFFRVGLFSEKLSYHEKLAIEIVKDTEELEELRIFAAHNIQSIMVLEGLISSELSSLTVKKAVDEQIKARKISIQTVRKSPDFRDKDWEEKVQQEKNKEEQVKLSFIKLLKENRCKVESGEYVGYLWELCRLDWNCAGFSSFSALKINEQLGEEWVEVAKTGLANLLEKPALLPCQNDETDDANFYAIASMIHQAISLMNHSMQHLSINAVNNAVAAITWDINSPPDWVNKLIRYHEADVKNILKMQLFNEAISKEKNKHRIHQFARNRKSELGRVCFEIIADLIDRKVYVNVDALVDASEIVARSATGTNFFNPLYEMYRELSDPRSDLAANIIAISPEEGLSVLNEFNKEDQVSDDKEFLIEVIGSIINRNTARHKLNRFLIHAKHLTSFVRIVLSVAPESRQRISEGVTCVTAQSEVTWFKDALYSMLRQLPYDVVKQFIHHVKQDADLSLKMPWISRIESDVIEKECNQPLLVENIESWFGGHWAKNIRTVKQLHAHITAILDDIHYHVSSDDFSLAPLWCALVGSGDEKDRTLEEHAQVWLSNELRYRSKGIYSVKREDQSKRNNRRDITISIPSVGSCVIEVKLINKKNKAYTYNYLLNEAINTQITQYICDEEHRAAILLLFATNPKKTKLPEGGYGAVCEVAAKLESEKNSFVDTIKKLEKFTVYPFVVEV